MIVDAVVTWVDGSDIAHQNKLRFYQKDTQKLHSVKFRTRFDQVNEIQFTVDSILKHAHFVRNIYIITDKQTPDFIRNKTSGSYRNVFIIDHTDIFKGHLEYLPVFNCRPIETKLYKVPNLSEHFIYFNDDMFLLKTVQLEDFFIDGNPVIRGNWNRFAQNIFYKRWFKSQKKKNKANHKKAQEKSAVLTGFQKYYKFSHVPAALRKSTFENFFDKNIEVEVSNIRHKFRHHQQFTPQGLANHLEIQNKTCVLKSDTQMLYIQNYKRSMFGLKLKLNVLSRKKNKLFLCLQSLDQASEEKLEFVLGWLKQKYQQ